MDGQTDRIVMVKSCYLAAFARKKMKW